MKRHSFLLQTGIVFARIVTLSFRYQLSYCFMSMALTICLISPQIYAQNIGINTTGATAHSSALLDVDGTGLPANDKKGVLVPRVSLVQKSNPTPVVAPANSLLVYNTATINDVYPGYYYWNGSIWVRLIEDDDLNAIAWLTGGNTGTTPTANFLGTIDNTTMVFRTNNAERMRIMNNGRVGINNTAPNALTQLDVNGIIYGNNFHFMGYSGSEIGNYNNNYIVPFPEVYDPHGLFAGNTTFYAPVNGYYFFAVNLSLEGGDGGDDTQFFQFIQNGAVFQQYLFNAKFYTRENREITLNFNCIMYLAAGQYAQVRIADVNSSSTIDIINRSFMGYLISK